MKKIIGYILVAIGILNIVGLLYLSSSNPSKLSNNSEYFTKKTIIALIAGGFGIYLITTGKKKILTNVDDLLKDGAPNLEEEATNNSSFTEANADAKVESIISSVFRLSLNQKIELALRIYQMSIDEEKATILSIWYQYKHDNNYFDDLAIDFNNFSPKIFMPPLSPDRLSNYEFILKSIKRISGYTGTEEVILNYIRSSKEEFEIDRLFYIIFAVDSYYDVLSKELLDLSLKNWHKFGRIPVHYDLLLYKTTVDILIYKEKYRLIIQETLKVYKDLENKPRLYWIKYQFTNVLLNLYENGFELKDYSEVALLVNRDEYSHQGSFDDNF